MKLLHKKQVLGIIKNVVPEEMGLAGDIELSSSAEPYKPLFDFLVNEELNHEEPPFDKALLEDWSIEDDNGIEKPIWAPALSNNYKIIVWRW